MTASSAVLALLASGVPLSLLADLADPDGPDSVEIARREGVPGLLVVPDPAGAASPPPSSPSGRPRAAREAARAAAG